MTDYMLMVLEDEAAHAALSAKAVEELIEKRSAFDGELRRAGVLRDRGQLRPSKDGQRVRNHRGVEVEAGPFAESGKTLCGYYWVEAQNLDEAAKLASRAPALDSDIIDIRPVMKGEAPEGTFDKPGKIFACAVLGNSVTEEAWIQVMDRIDAETSDNFPLESFLGGVRLEAPRTGKRLDRRAFLDGPFLESKEVIGGLFFMRMTNIEEAVRWAAESKFAKYGALEIRELWRT